jgi:hypothetical protein
MSFEVVRVLIAAGVAELGHEPRRRVAEVERHGIDTRFGEVVLQVSETTLQ